MKIHEVLVRDPRTARLANNGQARIVDVADGAAREELRAELETFVCDGTRPGSAASSAAASRIS